MRGFAVRNYYNSTRSIVYIMVIAKIGNPIIPDTSDASRTQYERLKKLSAEWRITIGTLISRVRALAKTHGLQ